PVLSLEHDLFGEPASTLGSSPRAGFSGSCSKAAANRSGIFVRLAPGVIRTRAGRGRGSAVLAGRRLVLGVHPAIVAVAARALHALLEADEAAIAAAAARFAPAHIFPPRIVLRHGGRIPTRRRDKNSQTSKQIPHGRPPGSALALTLLTPQAPHYSPAGRRIRFRRSTTSNEAAQRRPRIRPVLLQKAAQTQGRQKQRP